MEAEDSESASFNSSGLLGPLHSAVPAQRSVVCFISSLAGFIRAMPWLGQRPHPGAQELEVSGARGALAVKLGGQQSLGVFGGTRYREQRE